MLLDWFRLSFDSHVLSDKEGTEMEKEQQIKAHDGKENFGVAARDLIDASWRDALRARLTGSEAMYGKRVN